MKNCTRCNGLIVTYFDEALGRDNLRCICCAYRPLDPAPRAPVPHGLCKPRVGNLVTCECGNEKVEWRKYCRTCNDKKQAAEHRRRNARRLGKITKGVSG